MVGVGRPSVSAPFTVGLGVRIPFAPAESQQTFGPSKWTGPPTSRRFSGAEVVGEFRNDCSEIRDDISSSELRRQARRENDGRVSARLIALANALDGMDRASAARLAGMDRQTLRDWVHRYNAEGIAELWDRPRPGRTPKLSEGQMASLKAIVLAGPDPATEQIGRWR